MRTLVAAVVAGPIVMGVVVAGMIWRQVQRGITRSRIDQARAARPPQRRRAGLSTLAAAVARRRSSRGNRPSPGSVAALLDQTARHCASGVSLGEAFVTAVDGSVLEEVFGDATAAIVTGETISAALDRVPVDQPDVALATHVLRLCAAQGGTVSESLDRAAATLRERESVAHERVAQSAQARLSARVLTLLPIAFGGWTVLTTPTVQHFFLTPIGLACLLLGLGLNASGWLLMKRVSRP